MYYTGRLEVFNENFPAVSDLHVVLWVVLPRLYLLSYAMAKNVDTS